MTAEERFWQQWIRHDKEESRAHRSYKYSRPADIGVRFESEKGVNMRKASTGARVEAAFDNREPVDKVLDIWADYISLRDSSEPGGYSNPQDVKDFMRLGEAVEAMINNLKRHQWWAIRKSKGICTQWIFKDAIYEDALGQAKKILIEKMRQNLVTARYFS